MNTSPISPSSEGARDTPAAPSSEPVSGPFTDKVKPPMESNQSTGPTFPGAYPPDDPSAPDIDLNASVTAAKNATLGAVNAVRENLPSQDEVRAAALGVAGATREYLPTQDLFKSATQSAIDTARQYLPEGVAACIRASTVSPH
jgi:hypothetical protein